ncbi:hypothetical protein HaLaN_01733 [Haematococcus lacustris]|uniref:Uncharacterized protein n=1 Tax=Haematococcus lacustris TaxID=44745 RepID=A0A699YA27_HAELA|nr:hypothetical protein HaLaN_01733 [Haematococcus lacustris]
MGGRRRSIGKVGAATGSVTAKQEHVTVAVKETHGLSVGSFALSQRPESTPRVKSANDALLAVRLVGLGSVPANLAEAVPGLAVSSAQVQLAAHQLGALHARLLQACPSSKHPSISRRQSQVHRGDSELEAVIEAIPEDPAIEAAAQLPDWPLDLTYHHIQQSLDCQPTSKVCSSTGECLAVGFRSHYRGLAQRTRSHHHRSGNSRSSPFPGTLLVHGYVGGPGLAKQLITCRGVQSLFMLAVEYGLALGKTGGIAVAHIALVLLNTGVIPFIYWRSLHPPAPQPFPCPTAADPQAALPAVRSMLSSKPMPMMLPVHDRPGPLARGIAARVTQDALVTLHISPGPAKLGIPQSHMGCYANLVGLLDKVYWGSFCQHIDPLCLSMARITVLQAAEYES